MTVPSAEYVWVRALHDAVPAPSVDGGPSTVLRVPETPTYVRWTPYYYDLWRTGAVELVASPTATGVAPAITVAPDPDASIPARRLRRVAGE